ncbi:hypothetical protein WJ42_06155 [Burkholderia cepacia]|uniref:hypothetical protein n=1 Tax=Burkholderia cepacia TaxID=292 RepID=UPI000751EB1D|nr:hypothetical protein [Burkholderia cepacia]KVH79435.1 hypothetical protein WJ42_06155 [Burkholderia cepacia]KWC66924.1 hypothetical protein WL55_19270 [Burkholderia cepacia]KWF95607.1 hypothetical protein WL95_12465 [Burkholderia cepacia]
MTAPVPASWLERAPDAAPAAGLFSHLGVDWVRVVLALLLCLTVGVIAILVIRTRTVRGTPRDSTSAPRIRVIEHARLSTRATLHLIEYDQRVVLLMSDANGSRVVDARDQSPQES